ncbi:hypothetical protein GCM10007162_10250 [Ignatzschineria ureiclastica]|nr:hypothetical protein GCM10007162_10250 [Ignatzschineria ureiclastica]
MLCSSHDCSVRDYPYEIKSDFEKVSACNDDLNGDLFNLGGFSHRECELCRKIESETAED